MKVLYLLIIIVLVLCTLIWVPFKKEVDEQKKIRDKIINLVNDYDSGSDKPLLEILDCLNSEDDFEALETIAALKQINKKRHVVEIEFAMIKVYKRYEDYDPNDTKEEREVKNILKDDSIAKNELMDRDIIKQEIMFYFSFIKVIDEKTIVFLYEILNNLDYPLSRNASTSIINSAIFNKKLFQNFLSLRSKITNNTKISYYEQIMDEFKEDPRYEKLLKEFNLKFKSENP